MKPTIEMLFDKSQFEQLAMLPYNEMVPFVQEQFKDRTNITRLYIVVNIIILIVMIILGAWQVGAERIGAVVLISATFLGFFASLTVLIPIHEAIHAAAYKWAGAPKVSFGSNWKKFYFYAAADRFVADAKSFKIIALAPFIVISTVLIILIFIVPIWWQWLLWGTLLIHTGACAGDFGMLGFYERYKGKDVFTFDDVTEKKAYFLKEEDRRRRR